MPDSLAAINPEQSATVSASAGTGKTWMLVSRIIRLLLMGAKPESILAITFTRKAAAEMKTRLASRLYEFAISEDSRLVTLLTQINAPTNPQSLNKARQLYESLLHTTQSVHTATFHAFCQEILRRFPLEADISPGFDLVESTMELSMAAWDLLIQEATQHPNGDLARHLDLLMEHCHGHNNTQAALQSFLEHRSEWWAYTQGQSYPIDYAIEELQKQFDANPHQDPLQRLRSKQFLTDVNEFQKLLEKHPTNTNQKHVNSIDQTIACIEQNNLDKAYTNICRAFLTKEGKPLARKASKTLSKQLGESGSTRFLELHDFFCRQLVSLSETLARLKNYSVNCAWYHLGQRYLDLFQLLKREQRLLDFNDLEWKTYCLLSHSDNAHWVQYKLDQRIDHLLIDEFQDTNPTQWRLITPLLEELAAGNEQRRRSVFIVGDHKQSIYGFRRAEPELFDTAQRWLHEKLNASNNPLSTSWRSAPAIIQCVNWVFQDGIYNKLTHNFTTHKTHLEQMWGQVELLPLVNIDPQQPPAENTDKIRNPLICPRPEQEDTRHYKEGCQIAAKIQSLIAHNTHIHGSEGVRKLDFGDIMILLRHRTHAYAYEQALRETSIPYISADKGTIFDSLEIQDMVALLEVLITPYNNLALASVLRSPIFSCTNSQLVEIASQKNGSWLERLTAVAENKPEANQLRRAQQLLSNWKAMAGAIPVHDLLDCIYNQANILNRYHAAFPNHLKSRVVANLTRFIELALEIDSGRYPSISHFLLRLHLMRNQTVSGPNELNLNENQSQIRLMTIHSAKGMEAPVVFLADATNTRTAPKAYQAIVNWPVNEPKPNGFLLSPKKDHLDDITRDLIQSNTSAEKKEDANLLYVALTRAKQLLFISGTVPLRGNNLGWYEQIKKQLCKQLNLNEDRQTEITYSSGKYETSTCEATNKATQVNIPEVSAIKGPFPVTTPLREISPSHEVRHFQPVAHDENNVSSIPITEEDNQFRGIVIHRILNLLCDSLNQEQIIREICNQYTVDLSYKDYANWLEEAQTVFKHAHTRFLFEQSNFDHAYNELPVMYESNGSTVYGFIDRLIIQKNQVLIVDYKTHTTGDSERLNLLADFYKPQLLHYKKGIQLCWPDKIIQCYLLFTHSVRIVSVDD